MNPLFPSLRTPLFQGIPGPPLASPLFPTGAREGKGSGHYLGRDVPWPHFSIRHWLAIKWKKSSAALKDDDICISMNLSVFDDAGLF